MTNISCPRSGEQNADGRSVQCFILKSSDMFRALFIDQSVHKGCSLVNINFFHFGATAIINSH